MQLLDFGPYLDTILTSALILTAVVTGTKYFHKRYIDGLNLRIDNCIDLKTKKYEKRLSKLERSFALLKFFIPTDKKELLEQIDIDSEGD